MRCVVASAAAIEGLLTIHRRRGFIVVVIFTTTKIKTLWSFENVSFFFFFFEKKKKKI